MLQGVAMATAEKEECFPSCFVLFSQLCLKDVKLA